MGFSHAVFVARAHAATRHIRVSTLYYEGMVENSLRDIKRLIIMRHAEADWGMDDFDRPLTKRGHRQAVDAGSWLKQKGYIPEQLMSSAALRTRQTTTWISDALGEQAPTPHLDEGLYEVPASRVLARINGVSESVRTLMVVSHLPAVQDVTLQLASPDSDYNSLMDASYGFSPSSVAVFEVPGEWALLDGADARLIDFMSF